MLPTMCVCVVAPLPVTGVCNAPGQGQNHALKICNTQLFLSAVHITQFWKRVKK